MRHILPLESRFLLTGIHLADTPIPIATFSGTTLPPSTASEQLAGNKIVIVYGKSNELFGRIINPDNTTSAEVMLSSPTLDGTVSRFSQFALAATPDGAGFYLAYPATNGNNDFGDIFFAKFDASLNRTLDPVVIGAAAGTQSNPHLKLGDNKICIAYEDRPSSFSQDVFVDIAFPDPVTGQLPVQPVRLDRTVPNGFGAGGILDRSIQLNFVNNNFQVAVLRQTLTSTFAFESQQHFGQSVSSAGVFGNPITIYAAPDNNRTLGVPIIVVTPAGMVDLFSETFFNPANLLDYQSSQIQSLFLGMDLVPGSAKSTLDSAASPTQIGISAGFFSMDPATSTGYVVGLESSGTHDNTSGLLPADLNSLLVNYTNTAAPAVTENFVTRISLDASAFPRSYDPGQALIYIPTPATPPTSTTDVAAFPATVDFPAAMPPLTVALARKLANVDVPEGNAGTKTPVTFVVHLSVPADHDVTVNIGTARPVGSTAHQATAGEDYEDPITSLTIPAGQNDLEFTVKIIGDNKTENVESLNVEIFDPAGADLDDDHSIVPLDIGDDDPNPIASLSTADGPASVEGNVGAAGSAGFNITLDRPSDFPVTLRFVTHSTSSNTATPDVDYTSADMEITFAPGETSKSATVNFIGDNDIEPNETFVAQLELPENATLSPTASSITQTIVDDDAPIVPIVSITAADGQPHAEGSAANPGHINYTVSLSEPTTVPVSVLVTTAQATGLPTEATATDGSDYVSLTETVTFAPGETSKSVTVNLVGDDTLELTESFTVNLSDPTAATLSPSQSSVQSSITDDDTPAQPFLSIISITPTRLPKGKVRVAVEVKNIGALLLNSIVDLDVRASIDGEYSPADLAVGALSPSVALNPGETTTLTIIGAEILIPEQLKVSSIRYVAKITVRNSGQIDAAASTLALDTQRTATKTTPLKLIDPATNSPIATFITKNGTAQLSADANGNIRLDLSPNTDLSITPAKGKPFSIDSIHGTGLVKSLSAPAVDITGDITLPGGISTLNIHSLKDQHSLTLGGPATSPASLTLGQVANTTLTSTQPLKLLKVAEWLDTDATPDLITAPSIASLTSAGNFHPGLQIAGAVKSLTIAATLGGTTLHTLRAASFGNVTVKSIQNTNLFAGVASNALPTSSADFLPGASSITSFTMKGTGYTNASIAARTIGSITLAGVTTTNPTPFGIAAESIKSYARDKKKAPKRTTPGDIERLAQFSAVLIAP